MHCDRPCQTRSLVYCHDAHPQRRILFCEHARCFLAAFKRYVDDCKAERCYPFVNVLSAPVWIPRTAGGRSVGYVRRHTALYHNGTVVVDFSDQVYHEALDVYDVPVHNTILTKRVPIDSFDASHIRIDNIFASVLDGHEAHVAS